jgi:hypothetical protein
MVTLELEQNQSEYALLGSLRGGFFLRKKPLEVIASGYRNSGFALTAGISKRFSKYKDLCIRFTSQCAATSCGIIMRVVMREQL